MPGFKKSRDRGELDAKGRADADKVLDDLLAATERFQRESAERQAATGEEGRRVLIGIDRENRQVRVVPVDPPPDEGT